MPKAKRPIFEDPPEVDEEALSGLEPTDTDDVLTVLTTPVPLKRKAAEEGSQPKATLDEAVGHERKAL